MAAMHDVCLLLQLGNITLRRNYLGKNTLDDGKRCFLFLVIHPNTDVMHHDALRNTSFTGGSDHNDALRNTSFTGGSDHHPQARSNIRFRICVVTVLILFVFFFHLLIPLPTLFGRDYVPPSSCSDCPEKPWRDHIWNRMLPGSHALPRPPSLPPSKSVLLVGGAGYIGSHVAKYLRSQGHTPVVLDSLVRGYRSFARFGPFYRGSLSDVSLLRTIFRTHNIHSVMHFAAFAYVGESVQNPSIYFHNNIEETLYLLDTMVQHDVNRIIFSSTCATFGIPDSLPITEDAPQRPINPYGRAKLFVEQALGDYARAYPSLRYGIFRYFNAAGADPGGATWRTA